MVLAELGQRITNALASMSQSGPIDEAALDSCLKEIATALLQADVNVRMVANLRTNVKKRVNVGEMGQGLNKQRVIEKVRSPERHIILAHSHHHSIPYCRLFSKSCARCSTVALNLKNWS